VPGVRNGESDAQGNRNAFTLDLFGQRILKQFLTSSATELLKQSRCYERDPEGRRQGR
jgi:hypothetical protein